MPECLSNYSLFIQGNSVTKIDKETKRCDLLNAYTHVSSGSFKKKKISSPFGCWDLAFFYFLGCFHGNAHRGGAKQQSDSLLVCQ